MDYTLNIIAFKVGNYRLSFQNNIAFETFNEPENYYGIIFFDKNKTEKYQILECKLGTRILINNKDGVKDMPFNNSTAELLPSFIKIKNITKGNYE